MGIRCFSPVLARTRSIHTPISPIAYDCVKLIFVRSGSAILLSEFGEKPVAVGNAVALGANTLCGSEPEGWVTVTTLYLDRDYIIDRVFWQHAALLADRLDAQGFADELYAEPAQILLLGEDRAGMLMPWLDEMVALSIDGPSPESFYRLQALLFAVLDVIAPFVKTTPVRRTQSQRLAMRSGLPHHCRFAPLRAEAREAAGLLRTAKRTRCGIASSTRSTDSLATDSMTRSSTRPCAEPTSPWSLSRRTSTSPLPACSCTASSRRWPSSTPSTWPRKSSKG
nr:MULTISPECIES: hypothetical protein [Microbacterium]